MISTTIQEAIDRIEDWKGKDIIYSSVSGGITNPNYKVTVNGEEFFLKIPGAGTSFIDRNNCHLANMLAGNSNTGPKVMYYFNDTGVEVFQWLTGYRQFTFGDIYDEDTFYQIFQKLSAFHNAKDGVLPATDSLIDQAWTMNKLAKQAGYLPPWNDRMEYLLKVIEEALQHDGITFKPCHNDFWSNNMMYNDQTHDLKIIDFEYASMNDPYADLGTISTINYFTEDMDVAMIKAYTGKGYDELAFARMKLYKIVSDIKWGYWALHQYASSDVDYDYMNWYGIKITRLQHLWQDPRLDFWLNALNKKSIFRPRLNK